MQVCFFSATLHTPEITQLADKICDKPTWVDLKGIHIMCMPCCTRCPSVYDPYRPWWIAWWAWQAVTVCPRPCTTWSSR